MSKPECDICHGIGSYFRVPNGFNPFVAGGFATARAAYRAPCWNCSDAVGDSESRATRKANA